MKAYWILFFRNLRKGKLPLNRAIISDILLWMAVLALVLGLIWFFAIRLPAKRGQTIVLHFKDANELINGSSVQMLGTEVGYVSNIHIDNERVDVTAQMYPKTPPIPAGSTFTILFTGLGGSKSIEIELPDHPPLTNQPVVSYDVIEPIRMKQLFDANIKTTKALTDGATNIADFFGKKKPVEELQENIEQVRDWSDQSMFVAQDMQDNLDYAQINVNKAGNSSIKRAHNLNAIMTRVNQDSDPYRLKKQIHNGLEFINQFNTAYSSSFKSAFNTTQFQQRLTQFDTQNTQIASFIQRSGKSAHSVGLKSWQKLDDKGQDRITASLTQAEEWLKLHPLSPTLDNAQRAIQQFNEDIMDWSGQVDKTKAKFKALEAQKAQAKQKPLVTPPTARIQPVTPE